MANTKKKKTNNSSTKTTATTSSTKKKTTTKKSTNASRSTSTKKVNSTKQNNKSTTTVKKTKTPVAKKSTTVKNTTKSSNQIPKKTKEKEVKPVSSKEEVSVKSEKLEVEKKVSSRKQDNNNLFTIIGIAVLVVAIIVSCIVTSSKGTYKEEQGSNTNITPSTGTDVATESESIPENERKELTSIGIDEYLDILAGDEAKVVYIGRPTCSHCAVQKPIMENIAYKYDVNINYLNTDELNDEGIEKLQSSNEYFSSGWGTPLTLIVKNNEILDKASGETSSADMVALFKQYGIINQ